MTRVTPRARCWVAAAALLAGVFCMVVVATPLAESHGIGGASLFRLLFSPACHQMVDRCLDLGSGPLPICARCAGLYVGGFAGLMVTAIGGRRFRPKMRWLAAAALPSIIDFILGLVDLPTLANWPRFVAALIPGLLAGLLLANAISSLSASEIDEPPGGPMA